MSLLREIYSKDIKNKLKNHIYQNYKKTQNEIMLNRLI
jgi:hypothetical protein